MKRFGGKNMFLRDKIKKTKMKIIKLFEFVKYFIQYPKNVK